MTREGNQWQCTANVLALELVIVPSSDEYSCPFGGDPVHEQVSTATSTFLPSTWMLLALYDYQFFKSGWNIQLIKIKLKNNQKKWIS